MDVVEDLVPTSKTRSHLFVNVVSIDKLVEWVAESIKIQPNKEKLSFMVDEKLWDITDYISKWEPVNIEQSDELTLKLSELATLMFQFNIDIDDYVGNQNIVTYFHMSIMQIWKSRKKTFKTKDVTQYIDSIMDSLMEGKFPTNRLLRLVWATGSNPQTLISGMVAILTLRSMKINKINIKTFTIAKNIAFEYFQKYGFFPTIPSLEEAILLHKDKNKLKLTT